MGDGMVNILAQLFGRKPPLASDYSTERRLAVADLAHLWQAYIDSTPQIARAMPDVLTDFIPHGAMLIVSRYQDLSELSRLPETQTLLPEMLHDAISASGTHDGHELAIAWSALDLPGEYLPPQHGPLSNESRLEGLDNPPT